MIRATIDPIAPAAPVGAFMEPVSKLAVFAPYIALLGVVAAIGIAAVKPRKPQQ